MRERGRSCAASLLLLALVGCAGTHRSSSATPRREAPRAAITSDGCKDTDGADVRSDRCAQSVALLAARLHGAGRTCQALADGDEAFLDAIAFLPLRPGHFLLRLRCGSAAYNSDDLLFAYDDEATEPRSTPPLLLFPMTRGGQEGLAESLSVRDYDEETATLFHLIKKVGGGSAGTYAEYQIDRETFVPRVKRLITKDDIDYLDDYSYERGAVPSGKKWEERRADASGRLVDRVSRRP